MHSWEQFLRDFTPPAVSWRIGTGRSETLLTMFEPSTNLHQVEQAQIVPAYPHDGRKSWRLVVSVNARKVQFSWALSFDVAAPFTISRGNGQELIFEAMGSQTFSWDGEWITPQGEHE
jgi:hypothetical protein